MASKRIYKTFRQNVISTDTALQAELLVELHDTGDTIEAEFDQVTTRWKHKPKFRKLVSIGHNRLEVTVEPEKFGLANAIWRWVDMGTGKWGKRKSPYPIRPKRTNTKGVLSFRTGYQPRTAPVAKFNVGMGRATGGWVSKKEVMHPGIEPREFTETVYKLIDKTFKRRIDRAIRRAILRAR